MNLLPRRTEPNFLNRFMKKLARERVLHTISAVSPD